MIQFTLKHPKATQEMLGYLPTFWSAENPQKAKDQADRNYGHGGGWRPFKGFQMQEDGEAITYPGDPPMSLLAEAQLRDEIIRIYDCAWVAIVQKDGTFEICRMD